MTEVNTKNQQLAREVDYDNRRELTITAIQNILKENEMDIVIVFQKGNTWNTMGPQIAFVDAKKYDQPKAVKSNEEASEKPAKKAKK